MPRTSASVAGVMAGQPEAALRQRILAAAFALFTKQGFARTSTLEIATRARVSKRDIYALFASKQAMLAACIAERAKRMRRPLQLPRAETRDALRTTLTAFGAAVLTVACDSSVLAVHRLAIAESDASHEVARMLEAGRKENRAALIELLTVAQARGLIGAAPAPAIAEHFFALLWGDLFMNLLLRLAKSPDAEALQRRAEDAVAALLKLHAPP
jgi:AcrR family transcriptional regulator